jgi:DNA-directed RNA polymerase specialized sigma24 family protein
MGSANFPISVAGSTESTAEPPATNTFALLLSAWQASGDHGHLDSLLVATRPLIERTASRRLRHHHVNDPAAVDDTVSRVLDHLRRLPGSSAGERVVARFVSPAAVAELPGNAGEAYIVTLTQDRARDVARSRRRIKHRTACFSELSAAATTGLAMHAEDGAAAGDAMSPLAATCRRLHEVIPFLESRERSVIELLLDGKTQVVIAHALDVCEGTVSRLRSKAIESLRRLLDG